MLHKTPQAKLFTQDDAAKPFMTAGWHQQAELVTHLCQFSQNILLVLAPQEGGKTTFLNYCRQESKAPLRKLVLTAKAHETAEELFKKIAQEMQVPWRGAKEAYYQIAAKIEEAFHKEKKTWVFYVDDAHLLSQEQLEALLCLVKFNKEPRQQLHLVFFGEPSLELRLFSPEFSNHLQNKLYTIELESWTLQDVQNYFATESFPVRLSAEQIAIIFERSHGLPGLVIRETNTLLEQPQQQRTVIQKASGSHWVKHPISLGVMAGLCLGISYLLFNGHNEEDPLPTHTAQLEDTLSAPIPPASDTVAFHFEQNEAQKPVSALGAHPTAVANMPAPEDPVIASKEVKPAEEVPAVEEQEEAQQPQEPQIAIAMVEKAPKPVAEPAAAIKKKTIAATERPSAARQARLNTQEKKILAAKGPRYTVQLLGASNERNIKNFIHQHGIAGKSHYYRTKRAGKDWFVLVYGDYASQHEARVALKTLPSSLKQANLQPWVREAETQRG